MQFLLNHLPSIGFLWPRMLWLQALVPIAALLFVLHERRRRRRAAARQSALKVAGLTVQGVSGWRRHTPPVLMLLALASFLFAVARPQAMMKLPSRIQTVVLAMDTSGSMRAQDIKPDRMHAAREAAKQFLADQPLGVSVGLVSVAGTASVAQRPTRKKDDLIAALDRLQPQRGTALGNGLIISLATLLPRGEIDVNAFLNAAAEKDAKSKDAKGRGATPQAGARIDGGAAGGGPGAGGGNRNGNSNGNSNGSNNGSNNAANREGGSFASRDAAAGAGGAGAKAAAPASDRSVAIVLLSDGDSNTGPDVIDAAKVAADHGVRVYTVGIGTPEGVVISVEGWSARVRLEEQALKQVADMTGAEYFRAQDAEGLKRVYQTLSARLAFDKTDLVEISALFAALGALLAACAALLSLWWYGRVL
ncbi:MULTISPECIES: VWA domain-containing protein [unclassified Achromobacter]|uniref:VWA domain-containing protein n=1 Tax=unclassified Achromobacter TaxID=2626865 RepID=UPI001E2958C7|nr:MULTISPECIES: VWA domain-containing protein [unclassified Achromobacter]